MSEQTPDKHLIRLHNLRCEAELTDPLTKLKLEGLIETIEHYRNTRTTDRLVAKIEEMRMPESNEFYNCNDDINRTIDDVLDVIRGEV